AQAEVTQTVVTANGSVRNSPRNQHHLARCHLVDAKLGLYLRVAAELEVDHVAVDIAVETVLDSHHALHPNPVVFVLEDYQRLIGNAEHVKGPKPRCVVRTFGCSHQAGLLTLCPCRQPRSGKILPRCHELANLFLLIDFLFCSFCFSSFEHYASSWLGLVLSFSGMNRVESNKYRGENSRKL